MAKLGPFGMPAGNDVWTETPDGVNRVGADGEVRNSLYDATWVNDGCGYGAFPGDYDPMPFAYDAGEDSTGTVTGASSKKPIGRQR